MKFATKPKRNYPRNLFSYVGPQPNRSCRQHWDQSVLAETYIVQVPCHNALILGRPNLC